MNTHNHPPLNRLVSPDPSPDELEHLERCARCRVDRLRAVEFLGGDLPDTPDPDPQRYEDLGQLSRGGMGEVRLVRDRTLGRVVAMKVLGTWPDVDPERRTRFLVEAAVLARLQHPSIVPIFDRGTSPDGLLFFTMPYVRGDTLEARLEACDTLSERLSLVGAFEDLCRRPAPSPVRMPARVSAIAPPSRPLSPAARRPPR